jgi:hypothetical protein
MVAKSQIQDIFDKYRFDPSIAKKSKTWFEQQAVLLSKKRITPQAILTNNPANVKSSNSLIPGKLYMFVYDPKGKKELPYYDTFPLVFPWRKTADGFIGLNFHYLPHRLRIILLERLMVFANNQKMDETTKIRYSWALIDGVSKFNLAKPCVKQYLTSHLRTPLVNIPAGDWTTAMMLPVERFNKASKEFVWAESRKQL